MSKNSAKPTDLTDRLVHYRKKPAVNLHNKGTSFIRKMAFDPFTFVIWMVFGLIMAIQLILLVWLDFV